MIVSISPSVPQLKYYLQLALGNFETLNTDLAIEATRGDTQTLLDYLESIDSANCALADLEIINGKHSIGLKNC